jgi:hypothetical protein
MSETLQTPADVLRAARALIAEPERWTRGVFARDAKGQSIPLFDKRAERFCVLGACRNIADPLPEYILGDEAELALDEVCAELHGKTIPAFNDDPQTTHADVLALYDAAIARAESEATP